ncbi:hypothetical protein EON80_08100 [bacterium]|nr:MAG: hypothetical protein EON80_08100 [bacterium]
MSYQQLDKIADLCNPVAAVVLIILAFTFLKNAAWPFLLRNGLAVILVQQICKLVQKRGPWGDDFPSTHFGVALALAIGFAIVKPRLWPVALAFPILYGSLMLYQAYHTPFEMAGALFAIPLTLLFHYKPSRKPIEAAPIINN